MTSRKVILNMLSARKFLVPTDPEEIKKITESEDEQYSTHKIDDPNVKIYIFYPVGPKVGVLPIRQYVKIMNDNNVNRAIVVAKESITPFAKQIFVDSKKNGLVMEYFKENELLIDKLKHVLVPKHELIDESEKDELLQIYKLKEAQLPKILSTDPIARYFGARRGEVFKITRVSETAGKYINYRIVSG
jgi:DNA-directed RNA polymerase I, II, and III subunit RPABC1